MEARVANDRIADKARQLRFVSRVPMLCECSTASCRTVVMISLEEYREIRQDPALLLTAPGHSVDRTELIEATEAYAIRTAEASEYQNRGFG